MQSQPPPPIIEATLTSPESLTQKLNEWKRSVEGQWSSYVRSGLPSANVSPLQAKNGRPMLKALNQVWVQHKLCHPRRRGSTDRCSNQHQKVKVRYRLEEDDRRRDPVDGCSPHSRSLEGERSHPHVDADGSRLMLDKVHEQVNQVDLRSHGV